MTTVVVVDDQQLVRDGLRLILEMSGIVVLGEAADGTAGVELVLRTRPDVVLMDVRMPVMDGIEATERLVAAGAPARVLVLTTFDAEEYAYRALRAGAAGYLLKDVGGERLVEAVEAAARGDTPLAPAVVARLVAHYVGRPPQSPARLQGLSEREVEVLALVGSGRSNSEIAEQLTISLATVKSHIRHILSKLGLRDRPQAIVLAHECGIVGSR